MHRRTRIGKSVIGLAFVAAVATLVVNWSTQESPADARRPLIPPHQVAPSTGATDLPQAALPIQSGAPAPRIFASASGTARGALDTNKMFVDMNTAADLRVFVETVKTKPGGYLYASKALDECRILRSQLATPQAVTAVKAKALTDPNVQTQVDAMEWLAKRCAGFTDAELGHDEHVFLIQTARRRDTLYPMFAKATSGKISDPEARAALMTQLLASKDPTLIDTAIGMASVLSPLGDRSVRYVDGVPFGGLSVDSYFDAWRLAACAVAGTCEIRDSQVMHYCALEGKCARDVSSLVASMYTDPIEYAKVQALALRLRSIIDAADTRRLLPKSVAGG